MLVDVGSFELFVEVFAEVRLVVVWDASEHRGAELLHVHGRVLSLREVER